MNQCYGGVDGVGQWSGFAALPSTLLQGGAKIVSSPSSFWTSGFGQLLTNVIIPAGVSIGGALAVKSLTGGSSGGSNNSGGPYLNPAGTAAGVLPAPQQAQTQVNPPSSGTPQWVLPAAILGGALVLALALRR